MFYTVFYSTFFAPSWAFSLKFPCSVSYIYSVKRITSFDASNSTNCYSLKCRRCSLAMVGANEVRWQGDPLFRSFMVLDVIIRPLSLMLFSLLSFSSKGDFSSESFSLIFSFMLTSKCIAVWYPICLLAGFESCWMLQKKKPKQLSCWIRSMYIKLKKK